MLQRICLQPWGGDHLSGRLSQSAGKGKTAVDSLRHSCCLLAYSSAFLVTLVRVASLLTVVSLVFSLSTLVFEDYVGGYLSLSSVMKLGILGALP